MVPAWYAGPGAGRAGRRSATSPGAMMAVGATGQFWAGWWCPVAARAADRDSGLTR
jgi:hypothetical protein